MSTPMHTTRVRQSTKDCEWGRQATDGHQGARPNSRPPRHSRVHQAGLRADEWNSFRSVTPSHESIVLSFSIRSGSDRKETIGGYGLTRSPLRGQRRTQTDFPFTRKKAFPGSPGERQQ